MAILQQLAVPLDGMVFAFVIFELAHSRFSKHLLKETFTSVRLALLLQLHSEQVGFQSTK